MQLSFKPGCGSEGLYALACTSEASCQLSCDQKALSFAVHELTTNPLQHVAQSVLSKGSHDAALAVPTEIPQVSTPVADFQLVKPKPLGGWEDATPNTSRG